MAEDDLSFDLDAAGLRADYADIGAYVEALAHKLELALPAQTTVLPSALMTVGARMAL